MHNLKGDKLRTAKSRIDPVWSGHSIMHNVHKAIDQDSAVYRVET